MRAIFCILLAAYFMWIGIRLHPTRDFSKEHVDIASGLIVIASWLVAVLGIVLAFLGL